MRVLLIEDDRRLVNLIRKVLEAEQFNVDVAFDGEIGLELALRETYDLIIVDWMLPGRDGPSIVQAIRLHRLPVGILMLTARTQIEDRVAGLYSGADDYLCKPFSFDELIARLHALARRPAAFSPEPLELRAGDLVLDLRTFTARRGPETLELTKTEWKLLEYFMRHPRQVLSRQSILDYVWSYEADVKSTLVDVYVSYLRNKLDQPGRKNPIQTKRGLGYYLDVEDA